jgi:hypothetical protein
MHWKIATSIAAIAALLAWLGGKRLNQLSPLPALTFIICFGGLIAAINRCANALEKRKQKRFSSPQLTGGFMAFVDRMLKCSDCGSEFVFTAGEQLFYRE